MSRRREAAELARVLLLSTQEATAVARISPHALSSSDKHATQDSKEMELRPYEPHGRDHLTPARVDIQPTVRPTDVMGPPESLVVPYSSGSGSGARSDQVRGTATNTTSDVPTSAIRSFTPSGSSNRPTHIIPLSSIQPTTFPRPDQHQLSSPSNPPGLSHVSTPDKPTSSGSSHRPLFSPTQKSSQPVPAAQDHAHQPPEVVTYGRSSDRIGGGTTPTARNAHALTSSPEVGPTRAAEPWSRGPFVVSSDNEVEEEIEELSSKPRSTVQVVVPRRDRSIHRPAEHRHASPDPLYGLIDNPDPTSNSARKSRQSRSSVAAEESQVSTDGTGAGRRSSRVKENVEKKQAEQEARRKARQERKAREAEEERRRESGEASLDNRRKSVTTSREERKKRRSSEVLVLVDETMPMTETRTETRAANRDKSSSPAIPIPTPRTETKDTAPESRKRKSRFGEDEDELDSWHGSADEGAASPIKKVKVKAKAKDKKRNGRQKAASKMKVKEANKVDVLRDEEEPETADAPQEANMAVTVEMKEDETTMTVDVMQDEEQAMKKSSENDVPDEPEPSESGDANIQTADLAHHIPAAEETPKRSPLESIPSHANTPSHRPSPGPQLPSGSYLKPGGIRWKTPRNDLSAVLQKFNGARQSGMSKRIRIAPLHMKIGPPAKALPPVPVKPVKKKKGEESDEDEDEEGEGAMTEDEEGNMVPKVKKGGKGMEWYMVED